MIEVLDASVVIKWFCPEDPASTAAAVRILDRVKLDPRPFAVPELLFSECCQVFFRKFAGDIQKVQWAIDHLFRLSITRLHFDARVIEELADAMRHGLTGYDATYYAFASACDGRWLTFDESAGKKAPNSRFVCVVEY